MCEILEIGSLTPLDTVIRQVCGSQHAVKLVDWDRLPYVGTCAEKRSVFANIRSSLIDYHRTT